MDRRNFVAGTAALLPLSVAAQTPTLQERLLGTWRIVDAWAVNVATGAKSPWLGRPGPYSGILMYGSNGIMSVQIGAARPAVRPGAGFGAVTDDDKRSYAETWYGYFGRFEVDEGKSQVKHFIEGSLFAFETGKELVRTLTLVDGLLTLKTVNLQKGPNGDSFNQLTWARI